MPTPDDLTAAVLQAATERASRGPFNPDGSLTGDARSEVEAILAQADDLDGLSAALEGEAGQPG